MKRKHVEVTDYDCFEQVSAKWAIRFEKRNL